MLTTQRVEIPAPVAVELKTAASFVDDIMEYAREDLIGFRRPIAATFAYLTPIVCVFACWAGGAGPAAVITLLYFALAIGGMAVVGRYEWPHVVSTFEAHTFRKRRAEADLRCGFTEACFLKLSRAPRFFEHEHGVLVFADAGDFKTLFLSIEKGDSDPRWPVYERRDMYRRVWRWMRLPVSREHVSFGAEGSKLPQEAAVKTIGTVEAWEAIHTFLGEPLDGAVIHRPFEEIVGSVERLL